MRSGYRLSPAGAARVFAFLYLTLGCVPRTQAQMPGLPDAGRFRVGYALGEKRAGFSGRPMVMIFTNSGAPEWPSIKACIEDPSLEAEMDVFTGILVNDLQEPTVEQVLREQGLRVVVRSLNGGFQGGLHAGFSCQDLIERLRAIRKNMGGIPEKSPIYAVLLEQPVAVVGDLVIKYGCETAAMYVSFFEEFEGESSDQAEAARAELNLRCVTFLRGDANEDGRTDVSDAVCMLGYLFLGEPASLCEDGADANDDGLLNITDPIYFLRYLFLAADNAPPPPFPLPGPDKTWDSLSCRH